jgi:hypothetical protein
MRQDTQVFVGQQNRAEKEILLVWLQSVKLEGEWEGELFCSFWCYEGEIYTTESQENIPIHC